MIRKTQCALLFIFAFVIGCSSSSTSTSSPTNNELYTAAKTTVLHQIVSIPGGGWTASTYGSTGRISLTAHQINCPALPNGTYTLSFATNAIAQSIQTFNLYFDSNNTLSVPSSAFTVSNNSIEVGFTVDDSDDTLIRYAVLNSYIGLMTSETNAINSGSDADIAQQALSYLEALSSSINSETDDAFSAAYSDVVAYYKSHLSHFYQSAANLEVYLNVEYWVSDGVSTGGTLGFSDDCEILIGNFGT